MSALCISIYMSATYIEELGDIYGANVIEESETVGKQEDLVQKTDALQTTGPEAAEGFEPVKADSKVDDEGHVEKLSNPVTKKKEKTVKKESVKINNSTMKDINKSTFDRLFEDVMGGDMDMDLDDGGGGGLDLGDGDLGGDEDLGEDMVTLELPRDVADQLHQVLMSQLGDDDEVGGDGVEDIEDTDDMDEMENIESHVELHSAPDSVNSLTGQNNKAGNLNPSGGGASNVASGQVDGGAPKAAADGKGKLQGKSNKVADLRGNAFSK
jgi:hypothetical protein